MKMPLFLILLLLVIILVGVYKYPTPQRDFFKLYPYDDSFSQSLKEFQSRETSEIEVDGNKWTYYSGGKGDKTILFLHGMGGSYDLWWQQIQEFEKNYRVISYSLPENIRSLQSCSKGVQALLAKEKVANFIAVGTSMGGYIAQYLVNTIPNRVEKVVFGNTFPPNTIISEENKTKAKIIPFLPEIFIVKLADKKLREELIPAANNSELLRAFLPSIPFSKKQFINRYAVVIDSFESDRNNNEIESIPKLIIESDNDPLVQKELRTALKELYSDATIYTFNKVGHFPYINEAAKYNEVLNDFLKN